MKLEFHKDLVPPGRRGGGVVPPGRRGEGVVPPGRRGEGVVPPGVPVTLLVTLVRAKKPDVMSNQMLVVVWKHATIFLLRVDSTWPGPL